MIPISADLSSGKFAAAGFPARFVNNDGIRISVRKFRRCQPFTGASPTFFARAILAGGFAVFAFADFLISAFGFPRRVNGLGTARKSIGRARGRKVFVRLARETKLAL